MTTFYHAHVAGFTKHADSVGAIQAWLDGLRSQVAGAEFKVWRVTGCVAEVTPCICGTVTR